MTKRTIKIKFTTDKNGKPLAHYWGSAYRWLPISVKSAKLKLASGEAVPHEEPATVADPLDDFNYVGSRHHY